MYGIFLKKNIYKSFSFITKKCKDNINKIVSFLQANLIKLLEKLHLNLCLGKKGKAFIITTLA